MLLLCSSSVYAACTKSLVWGWNTYLPYASYDKTTKQWGGIDVQLISKYLTAAGCPVKLVHLPSKRALRELEQGRIDMVAAASFTEERNQYGYFSISYRPEKIVLFFRRGEAGKYPLKQLSDVVSYDLNMAAGLGGWYGDEYGTLKDDPSFKANLKLTTTLHDRLRMLVRRFTDVVIEDLYSGIETLRAQGNIDKVEVHDYTLYSDEVHLLLSRRTVTQSDIDQINKALAKMVISPEYLQVFGTKSAAN